MLEGVEDLFGGPEAAAESAMDGTPVAGGVRVFAGEEDRVLDGSGHGGGGAGAADADVAVRALDVWIGGPVVSEAGFEELVEAGWRLLKDAGESAAAEGSKIRRRAREQGV